MRKKKTREENEAASKVFVDRVNKGYGKMDKFSPYLWPSISLVNILFLGGRWLDFSPILFSIIIACLIALNICYFIPKLKKYTWLLNIVSGVICFTNLCIIDLLKGKTSSYIFVWSMAFPYFGIIVQGVESISFRIRKWLIFLIILIFLGLLVYTLDNPKIGSYTTLLLAGLLINVSAFITINEREIKYKQKEIEQLKQAQTQAKLSSLKDQLSPHFLFNTLNTITSMSQEQPVKDFVDEVANIYRYVLQYKEVDSVTIKQEIEFINSYLYIVKSRLEGGIDFYINVNDELLNAKMPPLTLQMLVENAVKHNVTSVDKPLSINIFTTDGPMMVVQNNFQPKMSVLPGNETGLKNIAERYQLLYKKEIIVENKNGFFTVKLPIVKA